MVRVAAAVAAWGWWVGTCVISCDNIFKFEGRGCSAYELQHELGITSNRDSELRFLSFQEWRSVENVGILQIPRFCESKILRIPRCIMRV